MNCSNRVLFVMALCVVQAGVMTGCSKGGAKGPPQRPPMSVKTAPVIQEEVAVVIDTFGNTKDMASINVVPQVSGMLLETYIADGARVTNGQALFLIDPSDYAVRVRQAQGAVAADKANLELTRLTVDRNQPLVEKGLISTEDFDTIKTRFDASQAQLQVDEATLDKAALDLSRCSITATVSGVCSTRSVDNGNLVAAGQTMLTNIRKYDPMFVDFSASEQYLAKIRRAMAEGVVKMEVIPRGDTNVFVGTVDFVDNAVDLQSGSIRLRGVVPNAELKLWAQQFVDVRILSGTIPNALMVPEGCIQYGKQGPYLFVVKADNTADMRVVKTGVRHNNLIQILDGVVAGENVVVLGQLMLYPGAAVMDMSQAPKGEATPGGAADAKAK